MIAFSFFALFLRCIVSPRSSSFHLGQMPPCPLLFQGRDESPTDSSIFPLESFVVVTLFPLSDGLALVPWVPTHYRVCVTSCGAWAKGAPIDINLPPFFDPFFYPQDFLFRARLHICCYFSSLRPLNKRMIPTAPWTAPPRRLVWLRIFDPGGCCPLPPHN